MPKIGSATVEINANDKASKVVDKVQGKLQTAGSKLQKIGGGMKTTGKTLSKYVTAPLVGVGGAAVGAAKKTGDYADKVKNTSQKVGMGTREYQEMTYALKQTGLEQEQSDRALGRLNQRMGRAADGNEKYSKALQAVGITQEDLENGTYSTDEAFQKIIGSLHDIKDPAERSAKASEIFGTNMSRQLMPAIEGGTDDLKKYMDAADGAGAVMGGKALNNSQKLKFAFDDLKDRTVGIVHQIGGKLAPVFTEQLIPAVQNHVLPMFESLGDKLVSAVEWFAGLSTKMQAAVAVFTGLAAAAGPLLVVLGGIVDSVGKALPLFTKIGPVLGALTSPVGLVVAAIAALTAGFITAYNKSETFRNIINKIKDAFMNAISGIKQFLTTNETILSFVDSVKSAFNDMKNIVKSAIHAIVSFFQSQIQKMKVFWLNNGEQIKQAFSNIFNGIKAIVQPVIQKIVNIVKASLPTIKQIIQTTFTTIKNITQNIWNGIKGVIDGVMQVIRGIIQTFSGLFTGDFSQMWSGIKKIFSGALKVISSIVKTVFNNIKSVIKGIWNGIKSFFSLIWKGIKAVFKTVISAIFNHVKNRFNALKAIIKTIFNAVKGFFSTVWSGIKGIFKKVINAVVAFVKNRFTNLKNNIKTVFNAIKKFFSVVWSGIKKVFTTVIKSIVNFAKNWWQNFKNNTKTVFNAIKKFFSSVWNGIKKIFTTVIKSVVSFVKNRFNGMKKTITTIWNGIKKITKSAWNGVKKFIIDPVKSGVKWALDKFGSFKKSVSDIFGKIKDGISDKVTGMIDTIKAMPGKMKKGIKNGAGKIKDGFLFVAAKMVDGIFAGVNGIIDGVNWAWHLLGGKKNKFDTLTPSAKWYKNVKGHAKGTDSHPGGVAKVNDGKGSNSGQELIQTPDGTTGMFKGKNVYADLPKGTQVLSAKDTKQTIPQYAWGTKAWDKVVSGAKATGGAIKSGAKWTGEKAKAAGKKVKDGTLWLGKKAKDGAKAVFNTAMKAVGVKTPGKKNNVMGLMRRSFLTVKDRALGKLKDRIKVKQEEEEGGGGMNVFTSPFQKTSGYGNRSNPTGSGGQFHHGIDFAAPLGTAVKSATSGTIKQAGFGKAGSGYGGYGNVASVMSNGFEILYTHLSKVLKKTGDKVKSGDKIGEVGTTGDSTGPHVHFEARKNGELKNTINPSKFLESAGGKASGKLGSWIKQGMKKAGVSGKNWSSGLNYIIGKESSGKPNAEGAATSDGTAKGLMQIKDMNMSGDPFDPVNNVHNGINYIRSRYGNIGKAVDWWKAHHWYAKGGFVNKPQTAMLGENNKREAVIPLQSRQYMRPFSDAVAANLNMGAEASGGVPNVTVNNTFNGTGEIKPSVRRRQQKKSLQDIGKEMRGL